MKTRVEIYKEIDEERARQDVKHGGSYNDDSNYQYDWVDHIQKQAEEANNLAKNLNAFIRQMIRVAALAVAAIESQERLEEKRGEEKRGEEKSPVPIRHDVVALRHIRSVLNCYTPDEIYDASQNLDDYESIHVTKKV